MKVTLALCPQANPDKPPLSLAYLGAYLTEKNIEVKCFDFNIELYFKLDSEKKNLWNPQSYVEWTDKNLYNSTNLVDELIIQEWAEEIGRTRPEIIGFSLLSTNVFTTLRLAKKIKARIKNIKIIFGGPEVYRLLGMNNYEIFNYADMLIIGEGEQNLYKVVSSINDNIKILPGEGIIIGKRDVLLDNHTFNLIDNIDEIPFPNYDWFPLDKYKEKGQQLPLVFSRGCIGRCSFCFEKRYWKKFRCRSVDNLIEEINGIRKKYGIWRFALNDSLINGNMQFLSEFCDKVLSENIKVAWWGMARINSQMTEEFLNKMVRAGCQQIAYGIESGSQKVLNLMHKNYDVNTIDSVILNTYKAGIKPGINLMLGFPGEEEEDFLQTCEFVKRNGKYFFYVNISTLGIEPFTDIYESRIRLGVDFKDSVNWQISDGKNNYEIRKERAMRLSEIVNEYTGKAISFI